MKDTLDIAGSTVVGQLTDIAPWEAKLILTIRLWMDSPDGQAEVWGQFARCFGTRQGRIELRQFETFLTRLLTCARRPLVRHGLGCSCIGSDEAILRTLVSEAERGDLAEAALIASLIAPAHHAEPLALMAARVGSAMKDITRHVPHVPHQTNIMSTRRLH